LRKQLDQYINAFPSTYDSAIVPLSADGLALQPVIPIVDGFACRDCPYKTRARPSALQHANKAHDKKWVADKGIFRAACLQSWFGEKRERYWIVSESRDDAPARAQQRASVRDVGEDCDHPEPSRDSDGDGDGETSHEAVDDRIIQDIEQWKADA
jgi:hypothetical protein